MVYRGLYPYVPGLKNELQQSRVMEIAPDIWFVEGYLSTSFFVRPPSSNCFILKDQDMVLLIDTGTYPFYRQTLLKILRRYRISGAKKLVLLLTQGHFDHICNNDIIDQAGYDEVHFFLPEVEWHTLNVLEHWTGEVDHLLEWYNPFSMMPMVWPTVILNTVGRISIPAAKILLRRNIEYMLRGVNTMAQRAEILPLESRVVRKIGDVTLKGWEFGRFFAIHDASHSPGHLSIYDPEYKALISGDATLEINPAFFNTSLQNCITAVSQFAACAEQGFVDIALDSHRSSIWAIKLAEELGYEPLHRLQTLDFACGRSDCMSFYRFFEHYYRSLQRVILEALRRLGEATIPQLVEEFKTSKDPVARFKCALEFPKVPSRLDIMVAVVLKEAQAPFRREKGRTLFSSPSLS